MSLLSQIFSQFRRGAAPPAQLPDPVLRDWLAGDGPMAYTWADLAAKPARVELASLMAQGADPAAFTPLLNELQSSQARVDRMLTADAWLRDSGYARAAPLYEALAAGEDNYALRAAVLLGECRFDHGEFAGAQAMAERAQALDPDAFAGQLLLGNVRASGGRHEEAIALFHRALAQQPRSMLAIGQLAVALMGRGQLHEGLSVYAAVDEMVGAYPHAQSCKVWNGEPLGTDRVLIIGAYGFGDVMQFLRFAGHLREREPQARLSAQVAPPLARLARQTGWFEQVHEHNNVDRAGYEWQISTMRLPLALGTTMADVPRHDACLSVAGSDIDAARAWLPPRKPGVKRVGLRWYGRPMHFDAKRSIPFARLAPLFEVPGIEWVALTEEAHVLREIGAHSMLEVSGHLRDFYDTGALMHELDLVISADTSTIHLAAALGRPVWMLARPDYEWRWGDSGESTPWYSSLRIFRHPKGEFDWDAVVGQAARELRTWAAR